MSFFIENSEIDSNAKYRLLDGNGSSSMCTGYTLKNLTFNSDYSVLVMNDKVFPNIVQLVDKQKYLYQQKKAKKDQEKKQKASAQKQKEVKFHIGIAENDKETKVSHIKEFLEKNCKVKVAVELFGREMSMKDMAKDLLSKILENFKDNKIEPVKEIGNSFFTFITR